MWRISLLLIILCAVAGGLYWHWQTNQNQRPTKLMEHVPEGMGRIVVAKKDIREGDLFDRFLLDAKIVDQARIAQDHFVGVTPLLGRHSNYDIPKGTAISLHDIRDADRYLWTDFDLGRLGPKPARPGFTWVVYLIRDVIPGKQISPLDLEMKEIEQEKPAEDPIHSGVEVIGKVAPNGFSQGQIIYKSELADKER